MLKFIACILVHILMIKNFNSNLVTTVGPKETYPHKIHKQPSLQSSEVSHQYLNHNPVLEMAVIFLKLGIQRQTMNHYLFDRGTKMMLA